MPKPLRRIRAVLFDVGGTLVDEHDFAGWVALARRIYLDLDADTLAHFLAEVEGEFDAAPPALEREAMVVAFWREVLARSAGRPVDAAAAARFVSYLRESEGPVRLFSDVRRCLDLLRDEKRRLGVISNSTSEASVRRILHRVGVLDYFERVVSSGTEGIAKPAREIFQRAVDRLGVAPAEAMYVGNLKATDALGATAAGLCGVWLHRDAMEFADDPPEIMSLLELPIVLRQLDARGPAPTRS